MGFYTQGEGSKRLFCLVYVALCFVAHYPVCVFFELVLEFVFFFVFEHWLFTGLLEIGECF